MNIPNMLTVLRVVLIPVVVVLFYMPQQWTNLAASLVFGLAAITDWFDGYLARKWDQSTPFGAFLDPVADKLMVAVSISILIERIDAWWFTIPAAIILCREILISALREWMAELGKRAHVAVSYVGKVKTTMQMIAIGILLAVPLDPLPFLFPLGMTVMAVAVILTLWSMWIYIKMALPELLGSNSKK